MTNGITNNNEAAPFKLKADGATKQLFTVPVGTVLVITENLTAEQQEAYSTSAEATATGTGSTTSSVAKVTGETNAYALTVADDTPVTVTVTNTSLGIDVSFEKINGTATGENMGTAQFTLYTSYTDETHNTPFQKAGSNVVSSSTVTGSGESTVTTITFEKVPFGVYYMRETTVPTGYTNANTYILLVGAANLTNSGTGLWASGAVLGDIRTEDVTAQRGAKVGEKYERDYAIFLIEDGKAVATPNIADKGLLNTDKRERKVILKKTDQANAPLSGAVFSILRADLSVLASGLTSGSNGAFWIGTLPYGIYYLHETTVPSGYRTLGTGDNWYRIQVDENGVSEPQRLSAKP